MQAVSGLLYWWVPVEGAWVPISAVGVAIGLSSAASQTMLYSHLSASWVGETDAAFACSNGLTGFAQCIGFFAAGTPTAAVSVLAAPVAESSGLSILSTMCQRFFLSRLSRTCQCVRMSGCAGMLPMHTMLMVAVPAQLVGGIGFCLSVAWASE